MTMTIVARPAFSGIGAMCDTHFIEADGIRIDTAIQHDGYVTLDDGSVFFSLTRAVADIVTVMSR